MTTDRQMTEGEYRVGVSFNPSGSEAVNRRLSRAKRQESQKHERAALA